MRGEIVWRGYDRDAGRLLAPTPTLRRVARRVSLLADDSMVTEVATCSAFRGRLGLVVVRKDATLARLEPEVSDSTVAHLLGFGFLAQGEQRTVPVDGNGRRCVSGRKRGDSDWITPVTITPAGRRWAGLL